MSQLPILSNKNIKALIIKNKKNVAIVSGIGLFVLWLLPLWVIIPSVIGGFLYFKHPKILKRLVNKN